MQSQNVNILGCNINVVAEIEAREKKDQRSVAKISKT